MLTISMVRKADRRGYSLHISDVMSDYPGEDKQDAASYINKVIEKEILRAPEQYLWVHRRFKTRPLGETSLY
jgi:KDO2-lipid IV(A) palmitoleoyltransferase